MSKKNIREDGISLSKQEITLGCVKYPPILDLGHNHRNEVVPQFTITTPKIRFTVFQEEAAINI